MSEATVVDEAVVLLGELHAGVDVLFEVPLTCATDESLLAAHRSLERLRNRLAAVEYRLIGAEEARGLPQAHGAVSSATFLRGLLRLEPGEANARAKGAAAGGPRRTLTGEPLEPVFGEVAAAQRRGDISPRHAAVIVQVVDRLPGAVQARDGQRIESEFVAHARVFDPGQVAVLGRRLLDVLDPDGVLRDSEYRQRTRELNVQQRRDGSGRLSGELTAECTERLLVHLDALAAPAPETGGVKDPRTAGQRRHDALLATLELHHRADLLPTVAGVSATVIVTISERDYLTGSGLATTSHGALIPTREALSWGGGDTRVLAAVLNSVKAVTAYSSAHRLFTENQRLALLARDGGCSFPTCPVPGAWTQTHHVTAYADGGPTSIDNATLLCGHHHRTLNHNGWTVTMHNQRPAWIPPPWIDPQQQPRHNHLHDTEPPEATRLAEPAATRRNGVRATHTLSG